MNLLGKLGSAYNKVVPFDVTPGFGYTNALKSAFTSGGGPGPVKQAGGRGTGGGNIDAAYAAATSGGSGGNSSYGGSGNSYGSSYSATSSDPATAAYYQRQAALLRGQLGQLDTTQDVGFSNIASSKNQALNRLAEQFGVAKRDYDTGVKDTQQGYQAARNSAATNARNKLSALQRLLGASGAGNSSATEQAVPLAVAQNASQEIAPVQTNYAMNRRNQDTAFEDTSRDYGNNQQDLYAQETSQRNALQQSIAQTKASLLSQIANAQIQASVAGGQDYGRAQAGVAGTDAQVNSLLAQIAQLGSQYSSPVLRTGDVSYKAPSLAEYLLGETGGIEQQGQPGGDSVNPLFVPLLGKRDEQQSALG